MLTLNIGTSLSLLPLLIWSTRLSHLSVVSLARIAGNYSIKLIGFNFLTFDDLLYLKLDNPINLCTKTRGQNDLFLPGGLSEWALLTLESWL